uniref:ATP synthase complex subunit 8 n=1 Tax=Charonia tritonis TaxID=1960912 RepID=A0A6M3WEF1_9CAEN|nr:ATP synthase F0 subunit 8 [Charonia tritonis]QJF73049.1 ATP synthase F0 subunit 8 [Charonia tritonis]WLF86355.1 ATP synthase F0 subunit 8 [Charonia tritonis]
MPQLSPLNWIFLFILFWIAVLSLSILIWWSSKVFFQSSTATSTGVKENKWNW